MGLHLAAELSSVLLFVHSHLHRFSWFDCTDESRTNPLRYGGWLLGPAFKADLGPEGEVWVEMMLSRVAWPSCVNDMTVQLQRTRLISFVSR